MKPYRMHIRSGFAKRARTGAFSGLRQDMPREPAVLAGGLLGMDKYRLLFENGLDAVLLTRPDGSVEAANPAACVLFRMSQEELVRRGREGVIVQDDPRLALLLSQRLRDGRARGGLTMRRGDGSRFEAEVASAVCSGEGGQCVTGIFVRDVSEMKEANVAITEANARLEERVRRRTAQLEAANRELESFALSVAHDLRAPLLAIAGFSQIVEEREQAVLSERGLHFVRRIRRAAANMQQMTQALLGLARVSHEGFNRQALDLAVVATAIVDDLRDAPACRNVEVVIEPHLPALGDMGLVTQLLANLLSNAFKFTSRRADPCIHVGVTGEPGAEPVYFVRDNGAGFDMEHATGLFRVFARLHQPEDYEGVGVGLATVQKIVTRHGGRVWAVAAPQHGATFHFTLGQLPLPQPSGGGRTQSQAS